MLNMDVNSVFYGFFFNFCCLATASFCELAFLMEYWELPKIQCYLWNINETTYWVPAIRHSGSEIFYGTVTISSYF